MSHVLTRILFARVLILLSFCLVLDVAVCGCCSGITSVRKDKVVFSIDPEGSKY
jgi:hypothetical protein